MAHLNFNPRTLVAAFLFLSTVSCVDGAYDLGNISLKMTLGPNGVTLPLGRVDSLTLDSIMRRSEIDKLVTEDGFYAYKLQDTISKQIDAVKVDPIRNIIPAIAPYLFKFTNATLPENVAVAGLSNQVTIDSPDLDFTAQTLKPVNVEKTINIDKLGGVGLPNGTSFSLDDLADEDADFSFMITDIPAEVATIKKLFFTGNGLGSPMNIRFNMGALQNSVKSGTLNLTVTLPSEYIFKMNSNYNGTASVNGNKITVKNYPITSGFVDFVFYIAERTVSEAIVAATISFEDKINYSFVYSGVANGTPLATSGNPQFSLGVVPALGDALIQTTQITPAPTVNTNAFEFEIDNLDGVSQVDYIAFTGVGTNALVLRATDPNMPLKGNVPVKIVFPAIFNFVPGIAGMNGNTYTTTMQNLVANNASLPLNGIRLTGADAKVVDGKLAINKPIVTTVSPNFPGDEYKLSTLDRPDGIHSTLTVRDMNFAVDADACQIQAGFTKPVEIVQNVSESFEVPKEVKSINLAQVIDATYGSAAMLNINLDIKDSPVDRCFFDHIEIVLPSFIQAEHPNLDPKTNTIRISRVEYTGQSVNIAKITLAAIKNVPVQSTAQGKLGQLRGEVRIKATANVPDNTQLNLDQTEITLLPQVEVSSLKVTNVEGKMDIDLKKYLESTTIDLADISKTLGGENVEINLIAPMISLDVRNPIGVSMVGSLTLQPYDAKGVKLSPVVVNDITIEPALGLANQTTKLFVTDLPKAPEGYTLCRVDDLSKIVKTIPSKIDVSFDMEIDESKTQQIALTGKPYPFEIDYTIRLPLKFKEGGAIKYSNSTDVSDSFKDISDYDITVDDIMILLDASTTLPTDLDVALELLDANGQIVPEVSATVLETIKGYNAQTDGEYKESLINILLNIKDGNVNHLQRVAKIRYTIEGSVVGVDSGLAPDQYLAAKMKLRLKKGITFDLNNLKN